MRKWKKVGLLVTVLVSVVSFAIAIFYMRTDIPAAASLYETNFRAAQQAMLPSSDAELSTIFQIPDEENGASEMAGALEHIDRLKVRIRSSKFSNADFQKIAEVLRPDLAAIERACAKPKIQFLANYKGDVWVNERNFKGLENWSLFLIKSALDFEKKGDLREAMQMFKLAAKVAISLSNNPTIIESMVRVNCAATIEVELERILAKRSDPELKTNIREILEILAAPIPFRNMILCEYRSASKLVDIVSDGKFSVLKGFLGNKEALRIQMLAKLPRFNTAIRARLWGVYAELSQVVAEHPNDLTIINRALDRFDSEVRNGNESYCLLQTSPRFSVGMRNFFAEAKKRENLLARVNKQ